jgi:hypothetical protein
MGFVRVVSDVLGREKRPTLYVSLLKPKLGREESIGASEIMLAVAFRSGAPAALV